MALERIGDRSAKPPVQITRNSGGGTSVVVYTVPFGRVFVGHIFAGLGSTTGSSVNGGTVTTPASSSAGGFTPELRLLAGTSVGLASGHSMVGVESDA